MGIIVVGLGPGDPGLLTRKAWDVLAGAKEVYLRTRIHPTVAALPEDPVYHSFDELYERGESFGAVYEAIVERLVELASSGEPVIYAVPGDPSVGEGTVGRLCAVCGMKNILVELVAGVSFIEPALAALAIDGIAGLQILDATDVAAGHHPQINPDHGALIAQVYNRQMASDVKLTLMNQYPDDHPVTLIHAAATADQRVDRVPLYEIDRLEAAHLTTLYVPPFDESAGAVTSFEGFEETIAHLRAPEGCPWDQKQTHESLRSYLIEEAYELLDAIDSGQVDGMREEMGDLLLQIVLHTQIAVDEGEFSMPEVIRGIDAKIKRRHPHVWGSVDVNGDAEKVTANWEQIKAEERADKGENEKSLLDGVPKSLPALAQAHEYDRRAARIGFDWPDEAGVVEKVREELAEVMAAATPEQLFHEVGDLLLAVTALGRWKGVTPEDALRAANGRFYNRFTFVERAVKAQGKPMSALSAAELDALWNQAKEAIADRQ